MRLQHNIMAMSAYRSYKKNVSGMKKNLERLASGYKINRAADDAASLAISEKMRAQITGEETALENAKDGISLVQTAEGALAEVHDILDRMVELATQSANGTYDDDTDRYQLQKEMGLLLDEINRIADSSNFNGIPLLDGSLDAGGSAVFAPGSFQINNSTLHPAGLDAGSIELPDVGKTLGENTVLHTGGTKGSDTNAFSIDLHNVILNANSSISVSIGNNVTITITNTSDKPVSAKDIVNAIEHKVGGGGDSGISVSFNNGAATATDDAGNKVLKVGDAMFKLAASGTRLSFTQTGGGDIEMPQTVTVSDAVLDVNNSASISPTQELDNNTRAQYKIDLSGVEVSMPGTVTIEALGQGFEFEITQAEFDNRGTTSIGQVLAGKLAKALADAGLADDPNAGALTFADNRDGTLTVTFGTAGKEPSHYNVSTVSVTKAVYEVVGSELNGSYDLIFNKDDNGNNLTNTSTTVKVADEEYTLKFVPTNHPDAGKLGVIGVDNWNDPQIYDAIKDELKKMIAVRTAEKRKANANYGEVDPSIEVKGNNGDWKVYYTYKQKQYIGVSGGPGGSGSGGDDGTGGTGITTNNFTGDYNKSTTVLQTRSESSQDRLASTSFDLKKLVGADGQIAEGTSITIGRNTYTFTYDADKLGKDGYVVLIGGENPDDLAIAAEKLTKAAENNLTYTVGHDGSGSRITITEVENQTYFDLTTMEGIEKSLGFKLASTTPASGAKGMTFQIGETGDSWNQLSISVKDCHTLALGIDGISIARQDDAAAAVNRIRSAIDYVSDVRGTLGATQNRLDHTINNLAVMAENVQDAESSIRDADIAEEMMSYTKNNILIQSAQAMLAQANQVPQGVLQLLQ